MDRSTAAVIALGALAAGASGGWVAGRHSVEPPPPPPPAIFRNPLAELSVGESIVLVRPRDGTRVEYRVLDVQEHAARIAVETRPKQGAAGRYEMLVSRNFYGFFTILEIEDPEKEGWAALSLTDTVVQSIRPETVTALGRAVPGWRIEAMHRQQGPVTYLVADGAPVHGLVYIDFGGRSTFELESWSTGPAK